MKKNKQEYFEHKAGCDDKFPHRVPIECSSLVGEDTSKQEHDFVGSHYCLIHKKVEERDSNKETEIWCDDCLEIHPWRV